MTLSLCPLVGEYSLPTASIPLSLVAAAVTVQIPLKRLRLRRADPAAILGPPTGKSYQFRAAGRTIEGSYRASFRNYSALTFFK